jgi:hypothetical protein
MPFFIAAIQIMYVGFVPHGLRVPNVHRYTGTLPCRERERERERERKRKKEQWFRVMMRLLDERKGGLVVAVAMASPGVVAIIQSCVGWIQWWQTEG